MPSTTIPPPFEAYRGDEPYAFVSYAHADADMVFPDLVALRQLGVNIWYDEGIDPGNEWPDEVAKALDRASLFICYVTPRAVASRNCRNEMHFALNREKVLLAIHLEETELPSGLALRMGDIQAVMQYRMDADSYHRKIQGAIGSLIADIATRRLVICQNCRRHVKPGSRGVCTYHPQDAVVVGHTGPEFDYADVLRFPCCSATVVGEIENGVDLRPARSPGCRVGRHVT